MEKTGKFKISSSLEARAAAAIEEMKKNGTNEVRLTGYDLRISLERKEGDLPVVPVEVGGREVTVVFKKEQDY